MSASETQSCLYLNFSNKIHIAKASFLMVMSSWRKCRVEFLCASLTSLQNIDVDGRLLFHNYVSTFEAFDFLCDHKIWSNRDNRRKKAQVLMNTLIILHKLARLCGSTILMLVDYVLLFPLGLNVVLMPLTEFDVSRKKKVIDDAALVGGPPVVQQLPLSHGNFLVPDYVGAWFDLILLKNCGS